MILRKWLEVESLIVWFRFRKFFRCLNSDVYRDGFATVEVWGNESRPKRTHRRSQFWSSLPSQLGLLEAGLVEKKNLVLINTYLEMTGAQDV